MRQKKYRHGGLAAVVAFRRLCSHPKFRPWSSLAASQTALFPDTDGAQVLLYARALTVGILTFPAPPLFPLISTFYKLDIGTCDYGPGDIRTSGMGGG
jgi:hypothetical protein